MKQLLFSLFLVSCFGWLNAQVSVTSANLTYTQNFDALGTPSAPTAIPLPGWSIFETFNTNDNMFTADNGGSNGGNTYSYGTTNATDRALGSLASQNSVGAIRSMYGVKFVNNTGATINSISISYTGEQWRVADTANAPNVVPDTLFFAYSVSATAVDTNLAPWVENLGLSYTSNITNQTPSGALDGNLAANRTQKNGVITLSVPNGGSFWIRWADRNLAGSDDGLAIDDLTVTFTTTTGPTAPVLLSVTPADNAASVSTSVTSLSMMFDQNITLGSGNISILDLTTPSTQSIPVSSCVVNANVVSIPGVTLNPNISYAVNVPATAFQQGSNLFFAGISNQTDWNFNTNIIYTPFIDSLYPADNSSNVALNVVPSVTFDKNVVIGTGNITIKNLTDATQVQVPVSSTDVSVSGATVSISNQTFLNGKSYAIQYDSTCFTNNGSKCLGVYDDVTWNFSTIGGAQQTVTSLNESFKNCLSPNFGLFTMYSVSGAQNWRCSTFGNGDSNAVYMNGFANGVSNDNEDWLISPPIDVSAMTSPYIHFFSKKRFSGNNTKDFLISSDYVGTGDPNLATWDNLGANLSTLDTSWKPFYNFLVTAYKANPFYIAFRYVSTAAGTADEWSIDDVSITNTPLSIVDHFSIHADVKVVNQGGNNLRLMVQSQRANNYRVAIKDLSGKILSVQYLDIKAGTNIANYDISALAQGMYLVQLQNETEQFTAKFVK